jgi:riboflavin kinase, archaea type
MEIKGKLVSGTHKGSYFMSIEVYQSQFMDKLGFKPYPGTLNLEISVSNAREIFNLHDKIGTIKGKGRFGDVKFIPAILNQELEGAIIFPVKSQHPLEIMEFVAPQNLRETLNLMDGDVLTITIEEKKS